MKETKINTTKFWAIVKHGDIRGSTMETVLIETDTATELNEILGEGSVNAGESMGEYLFKVLALSHNLTIINEIEEYETMEKENAELEKKYYEEQHEEMIQTQIARK